MKYISQIFIEQITKPEYRPRAEVYVIDGKGNIFVGKRKDNNEIQIPGGGIRENETPETAAIRECEEEICLKVKLIEQLHYGEPFILDTPVFKDEGYDGALTYSYVGRPIKDVPEKECRLAGPEGRFKRKLMTVDNVIKYYESQNNKATKEWQLKWNTYNIDCLKKIKETLK